MEIAEKIFWFFLFLYYYFVFIVAVCAVVNLINSWFRVGSYLTWEDLVDHKKGGEDEEEEQFCYKRFL